LSTCQLDNSFPFLAITEQRAELQWILSEQGGEVQAVFAELRRILKVGF
jgi:hypothetical protein